MQNYELPPDLSFFEQMALVDQTTNQITLSHGEAIENLNTLTKRTSDLLKDQQKKMSHIQAEYVQLQRKLAHSESDVKQLNEQNDALNQTLSQLTQELTEKKALNDQQNDLARQQIEHLQHAKKELELQIDKKEGAIAELNLSRSELLEKMALTERQFKRSQEKLATAERRIEGLHSEWQQRFNLAKEHWSRQNQQLKAKINQLELRADQLRINQPNLNEKINDLQNNLNANFANGLAETFKELSQLSQLTEQIAHLKAENMVTTHEFKKQTEAYNEIKHSLVDTKSKHDKLKEQLTSLSKSLLESENTVHTIKQERQHLEQRVATLSQLNKQLQDSKSQSEQAHRATSERLQRSDQIMKQLRDEAGQMASQLKKNKIKIKRLSQRVLRAYVEKRTIVSHLDNTTKQLLDLKEEVPTLKKQIADHQNEVILADEQVKGLQSEISSAAEQVARLRTALSTSYEEIEGLKSKLMGSDDLIKILKIDLENKINQIQRVEKLNARLADDLARARSQEQATHTKINQLESNLKDESHKTTIALSELAEKEHERQDLMAALSRAQQDGEDKARIIDELHQAHLHQLEELQTSFKTNDQALKQKESELLALEELNQQLNENLHQMVITQASKDQDLERFQKMHAKKLDEAQRESQEIKIALNEEKQKNENLQNEIISLNKCLQNLIQDQDLKEQSLATSEARIQKLTEQSAANEISRRDLEKSLRQEQKINSDHAEKLKMLEAEKSEVEELKKKTALQAKLLESYGARVNEDKYKIHQLALRIASELKSQRNMIPLKDYLKVTEAELARQQLRLSRCQPLATERPQLEEEIRLLQEQKEQLAEVIRRNESSGDRDLKTLLSLAQHDLLIPLPPPLIL